MTKNSVAPPKDAKPTPSQGDPPHIDPDDARQSTDEPLSNEKAARALRAIAEVSAKLPRNG